MHDMMVVRSPWTGSLIMFWCWASLEESGLFIRAWSIPEHPLLQPVTVTLNCIEDKWRKHKQWRKHTQMVKRDIRSLLTQLPTESLCLIVTYIVLTRNLDSYGIVLKQVIFNRVVLSQWLKVKTCSDPQIDHIMVGRVVLSSSMRCLCPDWNNEARIHCLYNWFRPYQFSGWLFFISKNVFLHWPKVLLTKTENMNALLLKYQFLFRSTR
jgi:hypothetical protein